MSPTVRADSTENGNDERKKRKVPKMYKSHPACGVHVVELPSGHIIWNTIPFWVYEV